MTSYQSPVNSYRKAVILSLWRRIYLNSHPDTSGFRIFYILSLIFYVCLYPLKPQALSLKTMDFGLKTVKMQNEPNFKTIKMTLSHFFNKTLALFLLPFALKNEPKTNPINVDNRYACALK